MYQEQGKTLTNNQATSPSLAAGVFTIATLGLVSAAYTGYHFLKEWLEKPSQLSPADTKRYHNLVSAHKKMGNNSPEEWLLTSDNRPTFVLYYPNTIRNLNDYISKLTSENSGLEFAHASLLSIIKDYLESLSEERDWYIDHLCLSFERPNGVEAMFLVEMISWLTKDFPNTSILSKDIIHGFEQRIAYCKEVQFYLSQNKSLDKSRSNFKDMLKELTNELDEFHSYLIQRYETANFNDLINRLGDNLLGISAHSLNTLYLLNNKAHQERLIVKQFLNPPDSNLPMIAMKENRLGKWLKQTLEEAGVKSNTFDATKTLSLDTIRKHLEGEHPLDTPCKLPSELKNDLSEKWGHWPFVTKNVNLPKPQNDSATRHADRMFNRISKTNPPPKNAEGYLRFIREIHRLTLEFYFIRNNLLRAATVTCVEGEMWIYGDEVGKAALDALLTTILEEVEIYRITFVALWTTYFQHYTAYAVEKNEDDISHPSYKWLNTIEQQSKRFINKTVDTVKDLITKIRLNALNLPEAVEKVQQTKIALFSDILDILEYKEKTNSANYKVLSKELASLKKNPKKILQSSITTIAREDVEELLKSTIKNEMEMELPHLVMEHDNLSKEKHTNSTENSTPNSAKVKSNSSSSTIPPIDNTIRMANSNVRISATVSAACNRLVSDILESQASSIETAEEEENSFTEEKASASGFFFKKSTEKPKEPIISPEFKDDVNSRLSHLEKINKI